MSFKSWIKFLVIGLLVLGIIFRFAHLGEKIYWVDEVATSLRVAGYTKSEVIHLLTAQGTVNVAELQRYQHPASDKNFAHVLRAFIHSPEHAPLYFLLVRGWVECFGSSIAAIRSLSVLFSLLALPLMYWLCRELFHSPLTGWLAIALLSISPFEVAYAQEARPYSLWNVMLLLSNLALLRAMRLKTRISWVWYTVGLVLSLYTSLLSAFVTLGQAIYVIAVEGRHNLKTISAYWVATGVGFAAFLPWLWVIFSHWNAFGENTTWMREPLAFPAMAVIWLYGVVIMFGDFPVRLTFDPVIVSALFIDLGLLILVCYSLWSIRQAGKAAQVLSLTLTFIPIGLLILLDLILGGQSSTAPRYMIPGHLGIWLAVTYLLTSKLFPDDAQSNFDPWKSFKKQRSWQFLTVLLISLGVASCVTDLDRSPKYQKTRNLYNSAIATLINQSTAPIVWAESEELMDIVSLSYLLESKVKVRLLATDDETSISNICGDIFLLNPSKTLLNNIQVQQIQIRSVYQPKLLIPGEISLSLWAIKAPVNTCSIHPVSSPSQSRDLSQINTRS